MFDLSTPATFLSVLVFLPAVVALFIAVFPLSSEQSKWLSLLATFIVFLMSVAMIFGDGPVEFRADTALWALVVFVGLFLLLRTKAWGPILDGLKKREETIRSSLEEAKHTRDEMARIQAQFQKELADAHQQIPKLLEEARKDAEECAAAKQQLVDASSKQEAELASHKITLLCND